MLSRRDFLNHGVAGLAGFSALTMGLIARRGTARPFLGSPCNPTGGLPLASSRPFAHIPVHPSSVIVKDLPFAPWYTGDDFSATTAIPFHVSETTFPGGKPPAPSEEADIVIVGGGLSGLTTAYLLREHNPVILELRDRFGGVSMGETWAGTKYSLGGAYFITPDKESWLESFYTELGLDEDHRLSIDDDLTELQSDILDNFWEAETMRAADMQAFEVYRDLVEYYGKNYPEIPLPKDGDNEWILDLDRRTLKEDFELELGRPAPTLLAAGIQGYCYSSFNAGWEEISAAAGWNFIAAEEFGRWVMPGGNAWVVDKLWSRLLELEQNVPAHCQPRYLRAGCRAVDVRLTKDDKVLVTYRDAKGSFRSILARRVVMCGSKHITKKVIYDLDRLDPEKSASMGQVMTNAYVVANVLIDAPIDLDFYDLFLLNNGQFPQGSWEVPAWWRVTDVVSGHYARPTPSPRSVLTLYWPYPEAHSAAALIDGSSWNMAAERLAPQVKWLVELLGASTRDIRQIRLARWGHAMPTAYPFFIASGHAENVRRPIEDKIFFVNQDNWALPAFETCLLEAAHYAPEIARGL